MATKLHQILALEKTAKATTEGAVTRAYHDAKKVALFQGLTRTYQPVDDADRDQLPPENKKVQLTAEQVLARAAEAWVRQSDVVATKDDTNTRARADVLVGGDVLLSSVPVTTLLYLEKMLINVRAMVQALPVLDPEVEWGSELDPVTGLWRSKAEETVRTKKVPKAFVKAPATEKHPAQVDTYTEDVIVGKWNRTLFSGALPAGRKLELLRNVEELQESVKLAREYANQAEVRDVHIGAKVFGYLI